MATSSTIPRIRRRADIESEEEAEQLRISQRSSPSVSESSIKRARNHRLSESPQVETSQKSEDEGYGDEDGQFQPGAIVRVKLTNFVTYKDAEFFPCPNLNMIIGPNGTGKSSLVCALCLGLGWSPNHLGRASKIGEFVKHGEPEAFIEIELQKGASDPHNFIVRLRIIRDGNGREWWLNRKKATHAKVQALMKSLSIQVDNLCQFLPQDKVSEFAGLSPVDLLLHTQRAAAPPDMLERHERLKKLHDGQKEFALESQKDQETLASHETRQQSLHAEVERLRERNQIIEKVDGLKKMIPFVEYKKAMEDHKLYKAQRIAAQNQYKELEASIAPIIQSTREKEEHLRQIGFVVEERKQALRSAELRADKLITDIEALDGEIKNHDASAKAESRSDTDRKEAITRIQRKIREYQAQAEEGPPDFDPAEWNNGVKEKDHKIREMNAEIEDIRSRIRELKDSAQPITENIDKTKRHLASLDTQEGQQMNKLERLSKDTASAWMWVQDNRDKLEKEVYAPALISCSIKDPRYTNAVESLINRNDFLCITAQTLNDMKKLSDQFHGIMKLTDVTVRTPGPMDSRRPVSAQDMQRYGLDGWAIDFIDGPEPVLAMLASSAGITRAAVTLGDNSEDQYNTILEEGKINRWVTSRTTNSVSRRREYGSGAVSNMTHDLQPAKHWTEQPIDVSIRRELQARIETLSRDFDALKAQAGPLRDRAQELKGLVATEEKAINDLKELKSQLQKQLTTYNGLSDKIQHEEELLQSKRQDSAKHRETLKKIETQIDHAVLRKAKKIIDHKDQVSEIRHCHEQLLEAHIRFIEADSDIQGLKDRNKDTERLRDEEKAKVRDAEERSKRAKAIASRALQRVKELMEDPNHTDWLNQMSEDATVEDLETEIAAEESKLEYIHANNPNAIKQFEERQALIDSLKAKNEETEIKLAKIARRISKIREIWEPELDNLIAKISDAFAWNFEQIGCAGEVSVHKDEDFNLWAIQIKVKFRETETLQILDAHRQSGGERSVSTIFYLMSLQSLAVAPFRVVDEINQGMDPRNERMVHERMVDIACQEHTSQYFLITPKLLTGLAYHRRMKVHCIASGEHMPEKYQDLDVRAVIGIQRAIEIAG